MTDFHTAHLLENLGRAVKMYDASLSIRIPTWPKLLWQWGTRLFKVDYAVGPDYT